MKKLPRICLVLSGNKLTFFGILKKIGRNLNFEKTKWAEEDSCHAQISMIILSWQILSIHSVLGVLEAFEQFVVSNLYTRFYPSIVLSVVCSPLTSLQYREGQYYNHIFWLDAPAEKLQKFRQLRRAKCKGHRRTTISRQSLHNILKLSHIPYDLLNYASINCTYHKNGRKPGVPVPEPKKIDLP